jgi:prepilin-type N-terminal cleavage/methylation domain-containing protein
MSCHRPVGSSSPVINRRDRRAFTIVELLVVVAIIGVLLAMLLPAVQAVRESARRAQCGNHLKQLGLGAAMHERQFGIFPTGGWGWNWVGDADRGFNHNQPGGWSYMLLNYIEQQPLAALGGGAPIPDSSSTFPQTKMLAAESLVTTPLAQFHCPTRRRAQLYPNVIGGTTAYFVAVNATTCPKIAKIDYAANAGDNGVDQTDAGPNSYFDATTYGWADTSGITGVSFLRSEIGAFAIRDGMSNTYLFGEKYLDAAHYLDGADPGDNEDAYCGWDNDLFRNTNVLPLADVAGLTNNSSFGSAHSDIFNMVFCDGSVHSIAYTINATVHQYLGNRHDNKMVTLKER